MEGGINNVARGFPGVISGPAGFYYFEILSSCNMLLVMLKCPARYDILKMIIKDGAIWKFFHRVQT